jgi:hypothetical protein
MALMGCSSGDSGSGGSSGREGSAPAARPRPPVLTADALLSAAQLAALPGALWGGAEPGSSTSASTSAGSGKRLTELLSEPLVRQLQGLTVPELLVLATWAHGEQRRMTAVGSAYLEVRRG